MSSTAKRRCRQMTLTECFNYYNREEKFVSEQSEKSSQLEKAAMTTQEETGSSSKSQNIVTACAEKTNHEDTQTTEPFSSCSDDLFPDSFPSEDLFPDSGSSTSTTPEVENLKRWPECSTNLPPLIPCSNHTVMFNPDLQDSHVPKPYPTEYQDKWDSFHVRMPCSPSNLYPAEVQCGGAKLQCRWEVICGSLTCKISTSFELENAIMKYNKQYVGRWDFRGLHSFFNECVEDSFKNEFFDSLLPRMTSLALQLPEICTQPIPLLQRQVDHAITLSQKQISCLLANAFFCTFPRRNFHSRQKSSHRSNTEYAYYPDINFNRLFCGNKSGISRRNEKLKCLLNYFTRVTSLEPCGTVTFHRRYLQMFPNWAASSKQIKEVVVCSDGLIETQGHGMLQVDFANRYVGGGVLGNGCVQEEIRFIICPELIISRLFTECLGDSEALVITGVEQYNRYSGYGDTFLWEGNFEDTVPRDAWGRKYTQLVAMDALHFRSADEQFKLYSVKRELNKAYAGFYNDDGLSAENLPAVATGNWGCGAFKGYPNLKFLIQLMAASQVERGMLYFTFRNKKLKEELQDIYSFIVAKETTIGDLWTFLENYCSKIMNMPQKMRPSLYEYIYDLHECDSKVMSNNSIKDSSSSPT